MAQQDPDQFDASFGAQDPTALFANMQAKANANPTALNQGALGLAGAGGNEQINQSKMVQQKLQQIIGSANQELDSDPANANMDPIDRQMTIAKRVASGMIGVNPQVAAKATESILKLNNAKLEQAKLQADTQYVSSEARTKNAALAENSLDPMTLVTISKDEFGIPTAKAYGNNINVMDKDGQITADGAAALQGATQDAQAKGVQVIPMKASQYAAMLQKMNEGRSIAQMARIQQQTQLQLMSRMDPGAIDALTDQVINRDAPPLPPPINTRNPVAMANYNEYIAAMRAKGVDPGSIDAGDFPNNTKTYLEFGGHGQTGLAIQSINVAMTHNELMRQWAAALNNPDPAAGNTIVSAIKQKWSALSGEPAPTNFDAAKDFVADENVKGILGGSGRTALNDREAAQEKLLRSASPQSINKVLDSWQDLQSGQLDGIHTRWNSSLQGVPQAKKDERWNQKISPLARGHEAATEGGTKQTTTVIAPNSGGQQAKPVTSQADYDALPDGASYSWKGQILKKGQK